MKLSTVLAAISADHIRQTSLPGADVQLYQACFLTSTSSAFTASTLYVAPTSVYLALPCHQAPSLFLLIPDGVEIPEEEYPPFYILLAPEVDANQLFCQMLSLLHTESTVTEAKLAISRALFDRVTTPSLIEIAGTLLGNPVLLQDSTTKLLARSQTEQIPFDQDEVLSCVVRQGFVSADLFQKYDYADVLRAIEHSPQAFLLSSPKKCDRILRRLVVNRQYFGWVCSIACAKPFLQGDLEIVDFLSDALTMLLEREDVLPVSSQAERLLTSLLSAHRYTEESFKKQAEGFGWKLRDNYFLVMLAFSRQEEDASRTMMAYQNHLSLLLPGMKSFLRHERLVLFFDSASQKRVEESLTAFAQRCRLVGSFSRPFSRILDFPRYYRQAEATIEIGLHLNRTGPLFRFEELSLYYMVRQIHSLDPGDLRDCCIDELIGMFRYDRRSDTSFALSLRVYLETHNLGAAAQQLHIHRNTMLYRVEKFSELTGLDLGSWSVRLRLMIGFIILDLYPELLEEE